MTRPAISGISPFFIVADVAASLAFYRDKLGFEVTFRGPTPDDEFFGIVRRDAAVIMFPIRTPWQSSSRRVVCPLPRRSRIRMTA